MHAALFLGCCVAPIGGALAFCLSLCCCIAMPSPIQCTHITDLQTSPLHACHRPAAHPSARKSQLIPFHARKSQLIPFQPSVPSTHHAETAPSVVLLLTYEFLPNPLLCTGLARDFQQDPSPNDRTNSFVGSPHHVAPDVLAQKNYSGSVDWWCFGVLLFWMLVGKLPFDGLTVLQLFTNIARQKVCMDEYTWVSLAAKELILGCLKKVCCMCCSVRQYPFPSPRKAAPGIKLPGLKL